MNNITTRLMELDPTLKMYNEGQWGQYNPSSIGYQSFNDAGVECQTGEFLYSMVRVLQAERVLETGTHWGVGAAYMGMAMKDNQVGMLDTVEFDSVNHEIACRRMRTLGITEHVSCHFADARAFKTSTDYDMIFLDTEPQTRFEELIKYYPNLKPGGYMLIHDLHRHMHQIPNKDHGFAWPFGVIPLEMQALIKSDKLRPFHFPTPRGLTGFYKVSEEDFKWM